MSRVAMRLLCFQEQGLLARTGNINLDHVLHVCYAANNYLFIVSNGNITAMCEICSKLKVEFDFRTSSHSKTSEAVNYTLKPLSLY